MRALYTLALIALLLTQAAAQQRYAVRHAPYSITAPTVELSRFVLLRPDARVYIESACPPGTAGVELNFEPYPLQPDYKWEIVDLRSAADLIVCIGGNVEDFRRKFGAPGLF